MPPTNPVSNAYVSQLKAKKRETGLETYSAPQTNFRGKQEDLKHHSSCALRRHCERMVARTRANAAVAAAAVALHAIRNTETKAERRSRLKREARLARKTAAAQGDESVRRALEAERAAARAREKVRYASLKAAAAEGDESAIQALDAMRARDASRRASERQAERVADCERIRAAMRTRERLLSDAEVRQKANELLDKSFDILGGMSLRAWAAKCIASRGRRTLRRSLPRLSIYLGYTKQKLRKEFVSFLQPRGIYRKGQFVRSRTGRLKKSIPIITWARPRNGRIHVRRSEAEKLLGFKGEVIFESLLRMNARAIEAELQRQLHEIVNPGERLWQRVDTGMKAEDDPSSLGQQTDVVHKTFLSVSPAVLDMIDAGHLVLK